MELKEAYEEKADAQLHEWRAWIDRYKADLSISGFGKATDRQRVIERLDDCHQTARIRLDELRTCQESSWEFSKQAVERAMIDLKRVLDESGAGHAARLLELQMSRSHVYEPFQKRG